MARLDLVTVTLLAHAGIGGNLWHRRTFTARPIARTAARMGYGQHQDRVGFTVLEDEPIGESADSNRTKVTALYWEGSGSSPIRIAAASTAFKNLAATAASRC